MDKNRYFVELDQRVIRSRQHGAVLIVALVLLLVLTVLGVAGVQNTTMQERMAGNYRDRFSAFQAAEAALRAGEATLASNTYAWNGSDGTYTVGTTTLSIDPLSLANYQLDVTTSLDGIASSPQYFIEKLPKVRFGGDSLDRGRTEGGRWVIYYRVSGRASGVSGKSEVVLQSTYYLSE